MIELKPCPFCGGEAKIEEITDMGGRQFQIRCTNCPTDVGRHWYWERKKVVEAWNRRSSDERIN